jgi:heat shock protein HslJ
VGRSTVTRWALVLVASTLVALTACGDDDDDSTDTAAAGTAASADAGELEGTTWLLVEGGQLEAPLDGVTVTALFAEGTLSGSSGCNTYTTMYELDGSSLSVAPEIASTMRACGDPETAVESQYLQLLANVAAYSTDASRLTLSDGDGEALLEFEATDDVTSTTAAG